MGPRLGNFCYPSLPFGLALLSGLTEFSQNVVHLATTDFLESVKQGKIESVTVSGQEVSGSIKRWQAAVPGAYRTW